MTSPEATNLIAAIANGDVALVRELVGNGVDFGSGENALRAAVRAGQSEILELLVAAGADVNAGPPEDRPVLLAAGKGHTSMVEAIVRAGADPNVADRHGNTPLMRAARRGRRDVVEILVRAGADVAMTNGSNESAEQLARQGGHAEIASLVSRPVTDDGVPGGAVDRQAGDDRIEPMPDAPRVQCPSCGAVWPVDYCPKCQATIVPEASGAAARASARSTVRAKGRISARLAVAAAITAVVGIGACVTTRHLRNSACSDFVNEGISPPIVGAGERVQLRFDTVEYTNGWFVMRDAAIVLAGESGNPLQRWELERADVETNWVPNWTSRDECTPFTDKDPVWLAFSVPSRKALPGNALSVEFDLTVAHPVLVYNEDGTPVENLSNLLSGTVLAPSDRLTPDLRIRGEADIRVAPPEVLAARDRFDTIFATILFSSIAVIAGLLIAIMVVDDGNDRREAV